MAVASARMSLEEFMLLPDRPGVDLELFDGEVVEVPLPTEYHIDLQERIKNLLMALIGDRYFIRVEFPYGFAAEGHRADVGAVPLEKWRRRPKRRDVPPSPPELLIEVLSPVNTTLRMNRLRQSCFENGCLQFWEVDPDLKIVTVFEPDQDPHVYRAGTVVSLSAVTGKAETLAIDRIFGN